MKTCIDAGHGGKDPGATGGGFVEKVLAWQIASRLAGLLRSSGHEVCETRPKLSDGDGLPYDTTRRRQIALESELLVSIHINAYDAPEAHGAEVFVRKNANAKNIAIADAVQASMVTFGFRDRGVKRENEGVHSSLAVLHFTPMAILVETGFLTCPGDRMRIDEPGEQDALAYAIAMPVLKVIGSPNPLRLMPVDKDVHADEVAELLLELEHLQSRGAAIASHLRRLTSQD